MINHKCNIVSVYLWVKLQTAICTFSAFSILKHQKKEVTLLCFGPLHDKKNLQISLRHVCSLKMTLKVDREKMLKFAPQQAYLIFWESFIIFYIPK